MGRKIRQRRPHRGLSHGLHGFGFLRFGPTALESRQRAKRFQVPRRDDLFGHRPSDDATNAIHVMIHNATGEAGIHHALTNSPKREWSEFGGVGEAVQFTERPDGVAQVDEFLRWLGATGE